MRTLKDRVRSGVIVLNRLCYRWFGRVNKQEITLGGLPRVSLCTMCMGRLHHLRETLPQNIADNMDYPNVEFVVLNYNSRDGMHEWMCSEMREHIACGRVAYYWTREPAYFHMAHSKNVATRLATGDIVCNVDADNYTGPSFAAYLAELFRQNPRRVVHGDWSKQRGTMGRTAVLKAYLEGAGGYDEEMVGWGGEDSEMIGRLVSMGFEEVWIREREYLRVIENTENERTENYPDQLRDWRRTSRKNMLRSHRSLLFWNYVANRKSGFGVCEVGKYRGIEDMKNAGMGEIKRRGEVCFQEKRKERISSKK